MIIHPSEYHDANDSAPVSPRILALIAKGRLLPPLESPFPPARAH